VSKAVTGALPDGGAVVPWGTVLTKARHAAVNGTLTADDVATLETWGHMGARSLDAVRQHDPTFAHKVEAALAA